MTTQCVSGNEGVPPQEGPHAASKTVPGTVWYLQALVLNVSHFL